MSTTLRKKIIQDFSLHGLSLKSEATHFLVEILTPYSGDENLSSILETVIETIHKQPLTSTLVGGDLVQLAVEECFSASDGSPETAAMAVINAFKIPKFSYNCDRKKFLPVAMDALQLHARSQSLPELFCERYTLLYQRTLRHDLFTPPALGQAMSSNAKYQLRKIEHLLSSSGLPDRLIVLGMLAQVKEGKYHLEDPTGYVELDISNCEFHTGIFVENCFVLAEGIYEDKVFHVDAIGLPPLESASESRSYFGNVNFFGGSSSSCAKSSVKLQAMLRDQDDAILVFLADVNLDNPKVMEKLSILFTGYADAPPTAFVFMGNFSSKPYGPSQNQKMKESFVALGDLILGFPDLASQCQFLFLPGPQDPGHKNILPRPPIPRTIVSGVSERIPGAQFCSNPVRIQFCTQEIVVFCEDILSRLSRNCVRFPSDFDTLHTHFVKTLLTQAHLCPLPLQILPVYFQYDHALRLYPLPDLVVLGDRCDPFTETQSDCTVTNVGSFVKSKFEFKIYSPSSNTVEDSQIE
jgi:DNA polymerase epsilon subunit 2